jgi:hypothetical protein
MSHPSEFLAYAPPARRLPFYLRLSLTILILAALLFVLYNLWAPDVEMHYWHTTPQHTIQPFGILRYLVLTKSDHIDIHNLATNTWTETWRHTDKSWNLPMLTATAALSLFCSWLALLATRRLLRRQI